MEAKKRIIIDLKKLTPEVLSLLVKKYPDGYSDNDIISFKNSKNELIEAVPLETDSIYYLVKISTKLANIMENYDINDSDFFEDIE